MALKLSGSISLTGSLTTDSSIVATVVTSSFFTGSYLDSLGNSGSADQILISDGRGGSIYKEVVLSESTNVRPASANKFSISWQDNLNFTASATSVYIPGEDTPRSQLGEKNITLAPADSTYPRFDVFIFSGSATDLSSGSIEVVQGTASENPVYPDVILNNEVPLKFVLIKAGAVVPSDGSDENNTDGADFAGSSVFSDNADDGNSWKSFGTTETSANISLYNVGNYGSRYYDQFDYGDTTYGNAMKWPREGVFEQTAATTSGYKDRFGFWHPDYNSEGSGLTLGNLDALEFEIKLPTSVTGSYWWTQWVAAGKQTAEFRFYLNEAKTRNYGGGIRETYPAAYAKVEFKDYVSFSRDDFQKVSIPASNFEKIYNGDANSKIIFIHADFKKTYQYVGPFAGSGDGMYIRNLRWVDGSGATVELDPTDETVSNAGANTLTTVNNGQFTGSFTGSFHGSYFDSLRNTGSADEILISDGQGGAVYGKIASNTGNTRIPASANDFSITWEGGLNFSASAGKVYMPGELDARSQQGNKVLTLSAGDSTHPRFDVFIFSASSADANSGSIEVIEGTPSENPVYPDINYSDELPLKFVLLKANAAVPSDGSDETNTSGADFSSNTIYSDNANDGNSWLTFGHSLSNANITSASFAGFAGPSVVDYEDTTYGSAIRWPRSGDFNQSNQRDIIMLAHPQYSTPGAGLSLGTLDNFILDIKFPTAITGSKIGASYARSHLTNNAWIDVELFNIEARRPDLPYNYYPTSLARAYLRFRTSNGIDLTDDSFQRLVFPSIKFNRDSRSNSNSKVNFIKIKFWKDKTNIIGIDPSDVMFFRNFKWDDGSGASEDIDPTGDGVSNASSNTVTTIANAELTGSFTGSFHGVYFDQFRNTGSVDQLLTTDENGRSNYTSVSQITGDPRVAASANNFVVSWEGGLNFSASAEKVYLPGELTPRSQQGAKGITLSSADSTHPRFDVFIFSASAADETSGSVEVIEGTPSANPIYPDIDSSTEVPLKFILLKAGASVPSDGSNEEEVTNAVQFSKSSIYTDNVSGSGGWFSYGLGRVNANVTGSNTSGTFSNYIGGLRNHTFIGFDYSGSFNNETVMASDKSNFNNYFNSYFGLVHPDWETGGGLPLSSLDSFSFDIKFPSAITGSDSGTIYSRNRLNGYSYFSVYFYTILEQSDRYESILKAKATKELRYIKNEIDVNSGAFQKLTIPSNNITQYGSSQEKINFVSVKFYKKSTLISNLQSGDDRLYIKNVNWDDGSGTPPQLDQTGTGISKASQTEPAALKGKDNTLASNAVSSVVVSGENNRVTTKRSFIGAGRYNLIAGNTDSVIGGGSFNSSSNACTFIGGGSNNILTGSAVSSSIVGGFNNSSSLANTHIIGSNITADKANYTYVNNLNVEGVVSGSTFSGSFVGDGSGLTGISGGGGGGSFSPYVTASNGSGILPSTGSNFATIGNFSVIGAGSLNTGSGAFSVLGGGCLNKVIGDHGFIGGGICNCITALDDEGFIGGGCNNKICSTRASIVGGHCNINKAQASIIGAGRANTTCGNCSGILAGQNNLTKCGHSTVVAGMLNCACGCCSGILGGEFNSVSHTKSFIIGSNLTSDKACYTFMNNLDVAGIVSASIFSGSFVGSGFVSSSAQTGSAVTEIITLAQSQYDAITPASDVLYVIV